MHLAWTGLGRNVSCMRLVHVLHPFTCIMYPSYTRLACVSHVLQTLQNLICLAYVLQPS